MIRSRGLAVLLLVFLATGCGGFQNPAGLTRRGATVELLSSCSDRGITEVTVIEAFVPDDPEPGEIVTTTTEDPDAEPVVLYAVMAPDGSTGESTVTLGRTPAGWSTTGSADRFDLTDRVIIEVVYGDAEGASTRLRLEQIAVGLVWLDDQNVEADSFADQVRECDPGVPIDGRPRTVLVLLAVIGALSVVAAPAVFVWSVVRDRQRQG